MADVFLSYSSKDRAAAQRVQEALAARGIDVFWDQETPPGQDWDTWIRGKLAACRIAVVLWSRTSVKSDNVRHEALVARKAKKLLPAMIDPVEAEDLPMGLYVVQATNLTDWRDPKSAGLARLAAEVEARLGRRAAGAAAAAPAAAKAGGSSPAVAALGLAVLVAGMAGVAWLLMQPQQPDRLAQAADRFSGNQVFAPGVEPETSAPQAACLDGTIAVDGVCGNGNRPIPPAPVLGAGGGARANAAGGFSSRILGRWTWEGQSCDRGPAVTMENGQLVFTWDISYVHTIDNETGQVINTHVTEPASAAGEHFRFTPEYVATSDPRNFHLVVQNVTLGTRDVWLPCS